MTTPIQLTLAQARQLAVQAQGLHALQPATPEGMLSAFKQMGCVQLDPISAVAKSHQLVLRNRMLPQSIDTLNRHLEQLLWHDHSVFEYWAHCASMVLTEDYPIHSDRMRAYLKSSPNASSWAKRIRKWVDDNKALANQVMREIKKHGMLPSSHFENETNEEWLSTGWTSGRNVSQMLDYFWLSGKLMVAGRRGNGRLWDLSERVLPEWTPRQKLSAPEVTRRAIMKAVKALGVATPLQIKWHFMRFRYPDLDQRLSELVKHGELAHASVTGLPGRWYIAADTLDTLDILDTYDTHTTKLLSPFDNLICDRKRTKLLWDFDFTIEIYVPQHKRKYGYYVLPVLHANQLIGRLDSAMNRQTHVFTINALHLEPNTPRDKTTGQAISAAITELGSFLGAQKIEVIAPLPRGWRV